MSRVNQYDIGVSIDGVQLGTFDKLTGGGYDSEETKYKPGGMAPEISLGGSKTTGNVTVSRLLRLDRDLPLVPMLKDKVGTGQVTVTKQSLDRNRNPYGKPDVYTGTLKAFNPPEPDSESNDAALFELEISTGLTQLI
jgi:hypothetical protein